MALNLIFGYTGMLSFGQATFFGLAAYTAGLMMIHWQAPLLVVLAAGTLVGALAAAVVGYVCIQRVGTYFIMLTFGFNQMVYFIAYKWTSVTGGDDGLPGHPAPAAGRRAALGLARLVRALLRLRGRGVPARLLRHEAHRRLAPRRHLPVDPREPRAGGRRRLRRQALQVAGVHHRRRLHGLRGRALLDDVRHRAPRVHQLDHLGRHRVHGAHRRHRQPLRSPPGRGRLQVALRGDLRGVGALAAHPGRRLWCWWCCSSAAGSSRRSRDSATPSGAAGASASPARHARVPVGRRGEARS